MSQPADFSVEDELLDEEVLEPEAIDEVVDDDEYAAAVAVETRSLLESPEGSISHADLGL